MIRSTRIQRLCAPLVCIVLLVPDVAVANCSLVAGNAAVTPDSRFSDNGNGTITDLGTALMWTKAPIASGPYTQLQAEAQADASTVGSHVDWRLPTRAELGSIIETGCSNPALNTTFFTLGTSTTFWTAETVGAAGFGVDFTHGISQTESSGTPKAVRLVRSAASAIFTDSFE
ncbi:MAG TPA: DUF1566 domain-containing protein [Pseudomonadota bacterium]|jgi:hypothetical protein|nr:DUF1566 domain-containing protein [Pseudomonadota bacterium]